MLMCNFLGWPSFFIRAHSATRLMYTILSGLMWSKYVWIYFLLFVSLLAILNLYFYLCKWCLMCIPSNVCCRLFVLFVTQSNRYVLLELNVVMLVLYNLVCSSTVLFVLLIIVTRLPALAQIVAWTWENISVPCANFTMMM